MAAQVGTTKIDWDETWRLTKSRFPFQGVFDRITNPADLEAIAVVKSWHDPTMLAELGDIQLVPLAERLAGPGASPIMGAFTRLNPEGGRFSNGSYGVYYASRGLPTAIAEAQYHREKFLRASHAPAGEITTQAVIASLHADLHDIRGLQDQMADSYDPNDYTASRAFARTLRSQQSWGIVYNSVRHLQGENAAIFRPPALSPARQGPIIAFAWNGYSIFNVYEKRPLPPSA